MQSVTIDSDNSEAFIISTMFAHQTAERKLFVASVQSKIEDQTFFISYFHQFSQFDRK